MKPLSLVAEVAAGACELEAMVGTRGAEVVANSGACREATMMRVVGLLGVLGGVVPHPNDREIRRSFPSSLPPEHLHHR